MTARMLVVTTRTAFAEPLSVALRASDLDYVGARALDAAIAFVRNEELPGALVVDLTSVVTDDVAGSLAVLCDALRAREGGDGVPIIFCGSGQEAVRSTTDALMFGGDGYFQLPLEVGKVVAKIATYIGCPIVELPETLLLPGREVPSDDPYSSADMADGELDRALTGSHALGTEERDPLFDAATQELRSHAGQGLSGAQTAERRPPRSHALESAERDAALERLHLEADDEERRLAEARAHTEALERQAEALAEDAKRREAEERARLAALERLRAETEAEAARAAEVASRRAAAEEERLRRTEAARLRAEEEAHAAVLDREKREAEGRARIEELEQRRVEAEEAIRLAAEARAAREKEAGAALEEAAQREIDERRRLAELEAERQRAEQEATRIAEDAKRRELEVKRALRTLQQREAEERARRQALEEQAEHAKKALLELQRREAEQRAQLEALEAKARKEEAEGQRRVAAIEQERVARAEALVAMEERRLEREEEINERLFLIEAERKRLEEEGRRELEERQRRAADEEARLEALKEERERKQRELEEATAAAEEALRREEARIAAVTRAREEAQAEAQRAIEGRQRTAEETERRLEASRRQRERLEAEARAELEALRRQRAEEELAQRELQAARARARLAFKSGRLDGIPPGERAGVGDVGREGRPPHDLDGATWGDALPSIVLDGTEPPAPPAPRPLEPAEGRFEEGELPALLWAAHHARVTAKIELTFDDGRERSLWLEEGEPVLVGSSLPVDRPEEALLRGGLITIATYNTLRAGPARSARRAGALLLADGLLKTEELFPAVRAVLTEQVLSLLEHGPGRYRCVEEHAHAADRVRLEHGLPALLAEGVRRKYDERRLWLVLGGPASVLGPDEASAALPPLSPEEKIVLVRLDGTRSLEDLVLDAGVAAHVVLRTALIAVSCGACRMYARGVPADAADRREQHERSVAIDRARVLDRLHAARHGDYFAFLGVDLHASPFEVQRAAERMRQRFDPARFADPAFADIADALREIVEVSYDAEAVLGDEALASGYRQNVLGAVALLRPRKRA
jgi:hypothetical protein